MSNFVIQIVLSAVGIKIVSKVVAVVLHHLLLIFLSLYVPLGTVVPNSRDQHEKNGNQILHTTKHTLKHTLVEKSRLKCTSNTINNITLL